jgi:hypothetical protein
MRRPDRAPWSREDEVRPVTVGRTPRLTTRRMPSLPLCAL